jgi:RNA polymerase primary sigma factor
VTLEPLVQATYSEALQQLIDLGRRQGFVTWIDLADCLPDAEGNADLLDLVTGELESVDIEITGERSADERDCGRLLAGLPTPGLETIDSDDTISLYFREVGMVPLLTRDEEVALAKRIERGRKAHRALGRCHAASPERREALDRADRDGQTAWEHLVRANSRLVISMAKKYRGQGVPFLDLIQEGNVGLMKAADKFDYRRGYKFSTYATWWIRQAVTRALANQGRTIRVPVHMSDRIRKLFAIAQVLEQDLGRRPTPAEIAGRMAVPECKVRQMLRISRRSLSLEKPVGEEQDSEFGQFIEDDLTPDPLEGAAQQLLHRDIDELLECLTAREARILRLRYGLDNGRPLTLKEVGSKFNLTRERIRQIEQEALYKLRQPSRRARLVSYLH